MCYDRAARITPLPKGQPSIPGLKLYADRNRPSRMWGYRPAEGNPTSDDSAFKVLCRETGEEVASLSGKFQRQRWPVCGPDRVYFNSADLMVERTTTGTASLPGYRTLTPECPSRSRWQAGWLSSTKAKRSCTT